MICYLINDIEISITFKYQLLNLISESKIIKIILITLFHTVLLCIAQLTKEYVKLVYGKTEIRQKRNQGFCSQTEAVEECSAA